MLHWFPPQGKTPSLQPLGVPESELGGRGASEATAPTQPITGDWTEQGLHRRRDAPTWNKSLNPQPLSSVP